jgi:hypothetical protein
VRAARRITPTAALSRDPLANPPYALRDVPKADANDMDFGNNIRCIGGLAVPATTDYDTIADRYAANIDDRPWNALYERPTTLALLPRSTNKMFSMPVAAMAGTPIGSCATAPA